MKVAFNTFDLKKFNYAGSVGILRNMLFLHVSFKKALP